MKDLVKSTTENRESKYPFSVIDRKNHLIISKGMETMNNTARTLN